MQSVLCLALLLVILFQIPTAKAQTSNAKKVQTGKRTGSNKPSGFAAKPALVVGIVIDQMRYDFLYKYMDRYGKGGFRRLLSDGFSCENTQYDYTPTYTGPGHASIYTGTTPAIHGICANDWYDRSAKQFQYCTADTSVISLGRTAKAGTHSPRQLLASTICDQLKLGNGLRSKTIGICLKDRGSILPAGHLANAAYWFEAASGNWISSSFYMKNLPDWVHNFNAQELPKTYLNQDWNTIYNIQTYKQSTSDNQSYEATLGPREKLPVFPHQLPMLKGNDFELLKSTPFGNTFTKEFAKIAIEAEQLGRHADTDFLALSFSSTDYVGHKFGPNSIETEDTYLRLDKDLEDLLNYLDSFVGKNKYLIFLTADHGIAPIPGFAKNLKSNAGIFKESQISDSLNFLLSSKFGQQAKWIENISNQNIFFDRKLFGLYKKNQSEAEIFCKQYLESLPFVAHVLSSEMINGGVSGLSILANVQRGYLPKRCGDMIFVANPGWFDGYETGTTHGTPYSYDTHVPLLWYGHKVRKGKSYRKISITDIAPTIASMLHILEPSGATGTSIIELLDY